MKTILLLLLAFNLYASNLSTNVLVLVKQHEGYSKHLYIDSGGYSIGYGTNLTQGLSKPEAELLLKYRLNMVYLKLQEYSWFNKQNSTRKVALIDLAYNLGIPKLLTFKVFIWRLDHNYYHGAANALKDSLWYRQVGIRAKHIYKLIYEG